ncbi:MAG: ABC transporter permease, partial [Lactobacillus sp.]|nr:ABC transporter permease [Lactobacillus sp.]
MRGKWRDMEKNQWEIVIEPRTRLLDIPIKELWQYRNMVYMLVKRNYQVEYKQTILGPFWMILGIVLSSGLFSVIFGYVGQFPSEGIPYFLFYMSAGILWDFFSRCVGNNSYVFLGNAYLFGKIYFPRMVVPIANMVFELVRFLIQFAVCVIIWLVFFLRGETRFMGGYLLLLPILALESGILGTAIGMMISSMTTKYRDL